MKRLATLVVIVAIMVAPMVAAKPLRCTSTELFHTLSGGDGIEPREIERWFTYGLVTFALFSDSSELFTFYTFSSCTHDAIAVRYVASCPLGDDAPCMARDAIPAH